MDHDKPTTRHQNLELMAIINNNNLRYLAAAESEEIALAIGGMRVYDLIKANLMIYGRTEFEAEDELRPPRGVSPGKYIQNIYNGLYR